MSGSSCCSPIEDKPCRSAGLTCLDVGPKQGAFVTGGAASSLDGSALRSGRYRLPPDEYFAELVIECSRVARFGWSDRDGLFRGWSAMCRLEKPRNVLVLRFGLVEEEPKTLEEIGKRLGLTCEGVRHRARVAPPSRRPARDAGRAVELIMRGGRARDWARPCAVPAVREIPAGGHAHA